jgi:hypothetical protein
MHKQWRFFFRRLSIPQALGARRQDVRLMSGTFHLDAHYLRAVPPVGIKAPADRVPAADDCEVYTSWTSESHVAGCR